MRRVTNSQLQLGKLDIADIQIDTRSRDDIPQLLQGLQTLYTDKALREELFRVLEKITPDDIRTEQGRPGMTLWNILVMGTLKLNLNGDYDRLLELANQHKTLRQMLGHGRVDDDKTYCLQTIKDNVQKLTPEILDEINRVLKPGGEFIFTDPMQADDCPAGVLQPVLERIHLDSLGSFAYYRQQAQSLGWEEVSIDDLTPQLVAHYTRVRQELTKRRESLIGKVSEGYIDRMIQDLGHWVDAGNNGYLAWGIMHFRKPA